MNEAGAAGRGTRLSRWLAFFAPVLATAVFLAGAACYLFDGPAYGRMLGLFGIPTSPGGRPFFDTKFVLAQLECWRRGVDVYAVNPCDPIGRLQDYSPLWLRLDFIPASGGDVVPLGLAIAVAFLASLFLLPPPRHGVIGQIAVALAMASPATMFALERGNTDALIVAMCLVAGRLLSGGLPSRLAAHGFVLAAAALKFYPAVLAVTALRERRTTCIPILAIYATAGVAFVSVYGTETRRALANTAIAYFGGMWGGPDLPFGWAQIVLLAAPDAMHRHPALRMLVAQVAPLMIFAGLVLVLGIYAVRIARRSDFEHAFAALAQPERTFLVIGATLTAGCFLTHANIGYRAIVLLPALPGILMLARCAATARGRILACANAGAAVFLLWNATGMLATASLLEWLLCQYVWWAYATFCAAVVTRSGLDAAARLWMGRAAQVRGAAV